MSEDPRRKWVRGALEALAEGGVRAVRVEAIARKIGVTKGSFYHHFANRPALFDAILETWRERHTEAVIHRVDRAGGDVAERFAELVERTVVPDGAEAVEVAIRAWAASDESARRAVRAVDERRLAYVTRMFAEAGLDDASARFRSETVYRVLIGDYLWRTAGGDQMEAVDVDRLVELFFGDLV